MRCSEHSIRGSDPGLNGYTIQPSSTDSGPESLQRIEQFLINAGYMTRILRATPVILQPPLGAVGTTTGWLLIWWRTTRNGLVACGSQWVADGGEPVTPFTTA